MANRFKQGSNYSGVTRFTKSPMSEVEFSSMTNDPTRYVPMNAGDIVPIEHFEVLPHSTYSIDLNFVARQLSASVRPTMGELQMDLFAFYVPNRIVNESWRNVLGENTSGFWTAPEVNLCPIKAKVDGVTQIPIGSIADYYGLPTQAPIYNNVLAQQHDLWACGYVSCFNNYFRSQDYMPPIPCTKLNVFKGFLEPVGSQIGMDDNSGFNLNISKSNNVVSDGSYAAGAVLKALYGEGFESAQLINPGMTISGRVSTFSALDAPLKACKLHDPFTSVLPTPQKGDDVYFGVGASAPVIFDTSPTDYTTFPSGFPLALNVVQNSLEAGESYEVRLNTLNSSHGSLGVDLSTGSPGGSLNVNGFNVVASTDLTQATGVSVNELRTSIATQQVLELLARGGSRYWEFLKSFFGVETVNPFPDIPTQIGHLRRTMDLYQVAQTTTSSEDVENSSQNSLGSLSAFGYTAKGGSMFTKTFLEHGYVHILGVIRRRPIYSTYVSPDKFRRGTLDFYLPQFANIGEQPIRLAVLNPFRQDSMERVIGYQEPFWEYRYSPNTAVGLLRTGVPGSLDVWHFGDYTDTNFTHVNGEWLIDDTQEVLDRTLRVKSEHAPQFICQFDFRVYKQLPMPVYSMPGLDTI